MSRLDSLGRTVARGDLTLEYDPDGQVATARRGPSTCSFVYDEAGQRCLKIASGKPVADYLEEGYLDKSGLAEPFLVGGRVVGMVRGTAPQGDLVSSVLSGAEQWRLTGAGSGVLAAYPDDDYLSASGLTDPITADGPGWLVRGASSRSQPNLRGTVLA